MIIRYLFEMHGLHFSVRLCACVNAVCVRTKIDINCERDHHKYGEEVICVNKPVCMCVRAYLEVYLCATYISKFRVVEVI